VVDSGQAAVEVADEVEIEVATGAAARAGVADEAEIEAVVAADGSFLRSVSQSLC
jgi:hypothetical protein